MNILVIAPHPDDESIGCGGALALHASAGDRVVAVFLTSGELGLKQFVREDAWKIREAEAVAAAAILGLANLTFLRLHDWGLEEQADEAALALRQLLLADPPDLIYLPHDQESHPDHRVCQTIVSNALNGAEIAPSRLLLYEVWTPMAAFDEMRDITPVMQRKLRAIRTHRSQIAQIRYDRGVRGLNLYRGALSGVGRYVEVFKEQ